MSNPIIWTTRASKDLKKIFDFYKNLYGAEKAGQIALEIRKHTEILETSAENFKQIGQIDENFKHLKRDYRKLIHHHCKITYRIGNSVIYITRVFDTRQNPKKNL
ncbi:MAG TPA: type II toxin-antitoxin system RelE/ParE family toxin [Leeuwenhoekiella sp.]|nr:type II toxin-antitoxin system RelE/ParE family toxin [Leeuwenhoekiella sp.]